MKQLCNCCPSFVDGLQLHPATLDTSTPQTPLDSTQHLLDTLDTPSTPSTPLLDTSTRTSMVPASTGLDRPRQASTGLNRPQQASTGLDTSTHRQQLDTCSTPRHRASTPRHQGSGLVLSRDSQSVRIALLLPVIPVCASLGFRSGTPRYPGLLSGSRCYCSDS